MQFGEVAADMVLFQFGERNKREREVIYTPSVCSLVKLQLNMVLFQFGQGNIQFSQAVIYINELFKIQSHVPITYFEDKY